MASSLAPEKKLTLVLSQCLSWQKLKKKSSQYLQYGCFQETLYQCHQTIATKVKMSFFHFIYQTCLDCIYFHRSIKTRAVVPKRAEWGGRDI